MKKMEEKIISCGKVYPGNILKVTSFLNHQIDADFLMEMGKYIADKFSGKKVDKVLTVEASGIAYAMAVAAHLHVPVLFAKKHVSANMNGDNYCAKVHSYTHGNDNIIAVSREFLNEGENVLIVDDFLATGNAIFGLMEIIEQAGANLVGASSAIEKGFQGGGDKLREMGIQVESLAIIESMTDDSITFRA